MSSSLETAIAQVMKGFARPWRWFTSTDWIVLEPPNGLIAVETMEYVRRQPGVRSVEAVFRATPHAGVYLRFKFCSQDKSE